MNISSKLPKVGTTIFTVMSALANEHGAINLSQGFPNYPCDSALIDQVSNAMKDDQNQYAPMQGMPVLRERISRKIEILYGKTVDPELEITITAGATQAIFTVVASFIRPGDEVILIEPAYDSYRPSVEAFGGIPVVYELSAPDYKVDWAIFRTLITPRTRMIMINSPQNPCASIFRKEDMEALERITTGTDILIMSDEVYEHIIFDGELHQSVLRFPELYKRSMITYSFGKTFHATGWKIGYCVGPPELTKEFRKLHQFNVFSVNRPMQMGIADYLLEPDNYLTLNGFFQKKRDFFAEILSDSGFEVIPSQGTYFQLARFGNLSQENDFEFARRMTKEFGVASIPVSVFYSGGKDDKVLRFCFAKTEETLARAGSKLKLLSQ